MRTAVGEPAGYLAVAGGLVSPTVRVKVRPLVRVAAAGDRLRATVRPARPGATALLQAYEAFLPTTQAAPGYLTLVLRTSSTAESIGNSLRSAIAGLDPALPVYRIRTARAAVNSGLGSISLLGSLLGAFATIGVILAAIGIYGVVSYTVVQRTGELGIRMALGAQPRKVLRMVLAQALKLATAGVLIAALYVWGGYGRVRRAFRRADPG